MPLTRDQIAVLMADQKTEVPAGAKGGGDVILPPPDPSTAGVAPPAAAATPADLQGDEISMLPEVASGVRVRWADVASPWLATVGGDPRGTRSEAAIVARVALRYDDEKADLVHDEEYEAVLFPLADPVGASRSIAIDYDDRDLRPTRRHRVCTDCRARRSRTRRSGRACGTSSIRSSGRHR
jgi:hypothetical protein